LLYFNTYFIPGDGTMRKNPDIWMKWSQGHALSIHGVQFHIARRGAEMLAIGGRMVYSTCSLNPIENEAVLCRLIRESEGALEIVDASSLVKGLKYYPGLSYWEPATKDLKFFKKFEDVPAELRTVVHKEVFPPDVDAVSSFNLQNCMRVLPHQQDTGGFFIAVLEKRKMLPWEQKIDERSVEAFSRKSDEQFAAQQATNTDTEQPRKKKKFNFGFREDPFVFFAPDEELFGVIKKFYDLSDDFNPECLLTRCATGKKKNIYLSSPQIREILRNNENNVKFINSGVKTFSRCDNRNMECGFRLAHEGLHNVDSYIGDRRRVHVEKSDLEKILNNLNPIDPPLAADMSESVQKQILNVGPGSCIIQYKDDSVDLRLVGWRGNKALRAYIDTTDSVHMLRMIGCDTSKYGKFITK
jgi:tRNA (cytosine34-C5)-methyltransferase